TAEESRFIRSKLPAKHAAKIGVSSLKTKPIRLTFTILICVIAFMLFGVLSTLMLYDSEAMFKQTMKDSNLEYMAVEKTFKYELRQYENGELVDSWEQYTNGKFNQAQVESIGEGFGGSSFGAIEITWSSISLRSTNSKYWVSDITGVAYMPEGAFTRKDMTGTYPQNKDEVCISSYVADMIVACDIVDEKGNVIDVKDHQQIIGNTIQIGGKKLKVTGIFDSGEIESRFDVLKENSDRNDMLQWEFSLMLQGGLHLTIGLSEEGFEMFRNELGYYYYEESYSYKYGTLNIGEKNVASSEGDENELWVTYNNFGDISDKYVLLAQDKTSLAENEAIVPYAMVYTIISDRAFEEMREWETRRLALASEDITEDNISEFPEEWGVTIDNLNEKLAEAKAKVDELSSVCDKMQTIASGNVYIYNESTGEFDAVACSLDECVEMLKDIVKNYPRFFESLVADFGVTNSDYMTLLAERKDFDIAGVAVMKDGNIWSENNPLIWLNDNVANNYWTIQKPL
ncbi:MAG: hypothetical protein J6Q06_04740, partial [Clostridia bacterium]|nr:hypothetical protein [Clostridia bacterium]